MSARGTLNHLQAWLADELAGRRRVLAELERQERAILAGAPEDLAAATAALERELSACAARQPRRDALLGLLGAAWGVSPRALTISSVVERSGGDERLAALRGDLRATCARTLRANRRVAALVRVHRELVCGVLETLLGEDGAAPLGGAGTLVNAEA